MVFHKKRAVAVKKEEKKKEEVTVSGPLSFPPSLAHNMQNLYDVSVKKHPPIMSPSAQVSRSTMCFAEIVTRHHLSGGPTSALLSLFSDSSFDPSQLLEDGVHDAVSLHRLLDRAANDSVQHFRVAPLPTEIQKEAKELYLKHFKIDLTQELVVYTIGVRERMKALLGNKEIREQLLGEGDGEKWVNGERWITDYSNADAYLDKVFAWREIDEQKKEESNLFFVSFSLVPLYDCTDEYIHNCISLGIE